MADEDMDLDAEGGEEQTEEDKKKKGGLSKLIIIAVLGLVILGGGFAGWYFFMADDSEQAPEEVAEDKEAAKEEEPGTMVNLEPFVVNLSDPTGKRYLKLSMAVDCKDEEIKGVLEKRIPKIRHAVLILLTSKAYSDIANVAGKLRLRNQVLKIINDGLGGKHTVHAVYFTEFVIQ